MPRFYTNLFVESTNNQQVQAFWDSEPMLFAHEFPPVELVLSTLTFKVSRKPKDLMAHLRRIYFCYRNQLSESLYAALLDFLIILDCKGRRISERLIQGSRSQLDFAQISALKRAVDYPQDVAGNRYSLFTSGAVGTAKLVEIGQKGQTQYDYLKLADDFVEFSQLEEAMSILEQGLNKHPERSDLQEALLDLYRSTNSHERFNNQYQAIKAAGAPLIAGWQALADFFDGKTI